MRLDHLSDTRRLAMRLADAITPPCTIALVGTLGSGKTQLVRFLVEALRGDPAAVTSPTYVLLQTYAARWTIHHLDFYRLQSAAQAWDLGIDELFEQPCVVLIEWADKFPECLPPDHVALSLSLDDGPRTATLRGTGPRSDAIVRAVTGSQVDR